jgi:hypothetical protein
MKRIVVYADPEHQCDALVWAKSTPAQSIISSCSRPGRVTPIQARSPAHEFVSDVPDSRFTISCYEPLTGRVQLALATGVMSGQWIVLDVVLRRRS